MENSRSLCWAYAALVLTIGLLLSLAELQRYLAHGGLHPWEPFLWELSSVSITGLLGLAVYRWHVAGLRLTGRSATWLRWARHGLGAIVYLLIHTGGMFGLRFAVYALLGVAYEPGGGLQILAYEAGKDVVSYGFMLAICHALYLYQLAQRLRGELAEAKLNRLTEQIQPHFLFNTLNLISSVMYEDVARADRILCDLATLLRHSLDAQMATNMATKTAGRHTLAQELTLVEPYLSIMQARFGERLSVQVEASHPARLCLLPAFLLIAPVENAIKHDVARSSGPVQISLRAWVAEGQLLLTVRNSGVEPERTERAGAVGLSNTRERLLSLYGERAGITLQADGSGGTLLSLSLPAELAA